MKDAPAYVIGRPKINPRIGGFFGGRGIGLMFFLTHPKTVDKFKKEMINAVNAEGPIDSIAEAFKKYGTNIYLQNNFAEFTARGYIAGAKTKDVYTRFIEEAKKEKPVEYEPNDVKAFITYLTSRMNIVTKKTEAKPAFCLVSFSDPTCNLITFEEVYDLAGAAEKGIGVYQMLEGKS